MRSIKLSAIPLIAVLILSYNIIYPSQTLALECYQCHGSKISETSGDFRPVDSPYRNISTGGFQGNHRTHIPESAGINICGKCHTDAGSYDSLHRNGVIQISPNINGSNLPGVYRNGSTVFPQRPDPGLGSCNNVNCHFEKETKTWGASPLTTPDGCRECHGSPPGGGAEGADGSHSRHNLYYAGTYGCGKCHVDHTLDSAPFSHATSAGRALVVTIQPKNGS